MLHYRSLETVSLQRVWLTIGSFDGVHRGHQEIIRGLSAGARLGGAPAVALTFFPHPARVLRGQNGPFYLTTPERRAELLGEAGADIVVTLPFDDVIAATSAYDFLSYLRRRLDFRQLWVGRDFALGRGREGNVERLAQLGEELDYHLHIVPSVEENGQAISSSRIRTLLQSGDVAQAAVLLGRPYAFSGEVIHGDERGRSIGIPTANLAVWAEQILPANGVYACRARVGAAGHGAISRAAAVNIGVRPTFDGSATLPHVEAHLLDFSGDLYSQSLTLEFIARLRGEQRFPGVEALVAQINLDIQRTREIANESLS